MSSRENKREHEEETAVMEEVGDKDVKIYIYYEVLEYFANNQQNKTREDKTQTDCWLQLLESITQDWVVVLVVVCVRGLLLLNMGVLETVKSNCVNK